MGEGLTRVRVEQVVCGNKDNTEWPGGGGGEGRVADEQQWGHPLSSMIHIVWNAPAMDQGCMRTADNSRR